MSAEAEHVAVLVGEGQNTTANVAPDTATASRLATLPEELLSNISVRLGSDDIFSLRLTCRDIEAKFATEYFDAKGFIFTTHSLQVLGHIASHAKLREYLTKVYFVPAEVAKPKARCEHGHPVRTTVREGEAVAFYVADQAQLHASGIDKQMIVEAFSKLPALRLLGVVDHLGGLPDGVECSGIRRISRTTGARPSLTGISQNHVPPAKFSHAWLSHIWTTAFNALVESGVTTLTRLETDLAAGLSPVTDLKFRKSALPQIQNTLGNLEELSLQIRTQNFRNIKPDQHDDGQRARQNLKTLAQAIPKVTKLKLNFDLPPAPPSPLAGAFFRAFMAKIDVGMLTDLSVDTLSICVKALASMVCKLRSIRLLSFNNVDVVDGAWTPILKALAQLPKLSHLHLMYLTEASSRVYFLEQIALDGDEWAPGDLFGQAAAGHEDQWTEDGTIDSDDEIPLLIPDMVGKESEPALAPSAVAVQAPCTQNGGKEYKAPGCQSHPERGYYVCLQGEDDIKQEIPRLIEKYNTIDGANDGGFGDMIINTFLGGAPFAVPPAAMGMAAGPPPGNGANANANAGGNPTGIPHANPQANVNVGGNPMANLQAMFGAPTQVGGNAQNGYATFAIPIPAGNAANPFAPFANLFGGAPPPAQQAPPQQPAPPPQQAPPPQLVPQAQPAPQPNVQNAATSHSHLPSWISTTEGASDDWLLEDEID